LISGFQTTPKIKNKDSGGDGEFIGDQAQLERDSCGLGGEGLGDLVSLGRDKKWATRHPGETRTLKGSVAEPTPLSKNSPGGSDFSRTKKKGVLGFGAIAQHQTVKLKVQGWGGEMGVCKENKETEGTTRKGGGGGLL